MAVLMMAIGFAIGHTGLCVTFEDIQDLLPGIDGNDPTIQLMVREELALLEAKVDNQTDALFSEQTRSVNQAYDVNFEIERLRSIREDSEIVNRDLRQINEELKKLLSDFQLAKTSVVTKTLKTAKAKFTNESLRKFEEMVAEVARIAPRSHTTLQNLGTSTAEALSEIRSGTENTWNQLGEKTNLAIKTGLIGAPGTSGSDSSSGARLGQ